MSIPEGNRSTLRISILWHATLLCKDHRCLKQHVYPQALPKKGRRPLKRYLSWRNIEVK